MEVFEVHLNNEAGGSVSTKKGSMLLLKHASKDYGELVSSSRRGSGAHGAHGLHGRAHGGHAVSHGSWGPLQVMDQVCIGRMGCMGERMGCMGLCQRSEHWLKGVMLAKQCVAPPCVHLNNRFIPYALSPPSLITVHAPPMRSLCT